MSAELPEGITTLGGSVPWERVFVVSPLVVVGTREPDGRYDLAPKHMAMPVGWDGFFAFACTPAHGTYWNARREGAFTVSYPRPSQVVLTSLAASPRCGDDGSKPIVDAIPTFAATRVDGVLLSDAYLYLECELERVVDDLGAASLVIGRIVVSHAHEEALRAHDRDDQEVLRDRPLLAYLSPGRWARIERSEGFPLPAGYEDDR